ncbi:MAG TPA: FAD-dependent oxidoreductase [Gaiellaceae bacterium]|nr:FAD-dependent oxidoreductase [Gaiellaceae bacterium]
METTPFWLAEPAEPLPSGRVDGVADVAVVGGGITGCSCALALAQAGRKVRLFEAREVAGGASGRNGGFALRGGAAPYPVLAASIGEEPTASLWRWTEAELVELASLADDAFRATGSLRLAVDEEEREELRQEYESLRTAGFAAEWREPLPSPLTGRYPAALFHPPDGVLQPARLVRRIARRAAEAGVEIHEHTRVESLADANASTVVIATDGYPSGLLGGLEGLIVPTRGQVVATEPIEELLFEIPHYGRHGFDYWHQRRDGRIVAGGFRDVSLDTEFTAQEATTEIVQNALERFVEEHVGRPLRIDYRWAGIFGMVFDFLPVVGRVPGADGLWVAGGYSGHGNVLGFACGRLVARAILGEDDPKLALFDPARLLVH